MRVQVKGKHVTVTPELEKLAASRLEKLERRFGAALVSAQVVLSAEKNRLLVELTVHARGDHILHGIGNSKAWGPSLTEAVSKVVQQVGTVKGKWDARKRGSKAPRTGATPRVARTTSR